MSDADCLRQAEADATSMRAQGYEPASQSWADDSGLRVLTVAYRSSGRPAFGPTGYMPAAAPPATAGGLTGRNLASIAGAAWLICALLVGALALQQFSAADTIDKLRVQFGANNAAFSGLADLRTYASWNVIAAILTVITALKILREPSKELLNWSVAWAVVNVAVLVLQPTAAANGAFLGSVVAAAVAGIAAFAARQQSEFSL